VDGATEREALIFRVCFGPRENHPPDSVAPTVLVEAEYGLSQGFVRRGGLHPGLLSTGPYGSADCWQRSRTSLSGWSRSDIAGWVARI